MDLLSAYAYRERRVRAVFSSAVALGGYNKTLYSISSEDSTASDPTIKAVYGVAGQPTTIELILDFDMIDGAAYVLRAGLVPAVVGGTSPTDQTTRYRYGSPAKKTNTEPLVSDFDVILYGRDIIWNGDFEEGADGDLAVVSGLPNAVSALDNRLKGGPLPYAPGFGPDSREFVDSNDSTPLGPRLRQQALRDPRVKSVTITADEDDKGDTVFVITPVFIGDRKPEPISMTVDT